MARFTNVSGEDLLLFARAGQAESLAVPPGGVVDIPGDVTAETSDAVVVGDGDDARTWPSALWQLERSDDSGVQAPQLGEDTAADAEERANQRARENVAVSQGTPAERAAHTAAAAEGTAPENASENVTVKTGGTTSTAKGE